MVVVVGGGVVEVEVELVEVELVVVLLEVVELVVEEVVVELVDDDVVELLVVDEVVELVVVLDVVVGAGVVVVDELVSGVLPTYVTTPPTIVRYVPTLMGTGWTGLGRLELVLDPVPNGELPVTLGVSNCEIITPFVVWNVEMESLPHTQGRLAIWELPRYSLIE